MYVEQKYDDGIYHSASVWDGPLDHISDLSSRSKAILIEEGH